jgi:hypothetical protein
VVWELNPRRFLNNLLEIDRAHLELVSEEPTEPSLEGTCGLAEIQLSDSRRFVVCTTDYELVQRVHILNRIVDTYRGCSRLDRTMAREVEPLIPIYPNLCGLVVFPKFNIYDLLRLAGEGYLLPTGITRFTISPRALHVDYPLSELASDRPIEEKNAALERWLQDRLNRKGIRYYAEATFLFDE